MPTALHICTQLISTSLLCCVLLCVPTVVNTALQEAVKDPIDLAAMRRRMEGAEGLTPYSSKAAFRADLDRMIANCRAFNTAPSAYTEAADAVEQSIAEIFGDAVTGDSND
jgi:Bromodomain